MLPVLATGTYFYCERASESLLAEPLNVLTNLGFLIAVSLLVHKVRSGDIPRLASGARLLVWLMVTIGIGSLVFHAAAGWTVVLDVVPIAAFILAYFAMVTHHLFGQPWKRSVVVVAVFLLLSLALATTIGFVAVYLSAWAAFMGSAVALLSSAELSRYGRRMVEIGLLFALALVFRQLDDPLCSAIPTGTHFMWHLVNAVVLYRAVCLIADAERLNLPKGPIIGQRTAA